MRGRLRQGMRRLTKADLKASAIVSAKGTVAATAVFAAVILSPLLEWAGYPRRTWAEAVAVTVEYFLVIAVVIVTSVLLTKWLEPES